VDCATQNAEACRKQTFTVSANHLPSEAPLLSLPDSRPDVPSTKRAGAAPIPVPLKGIRAHLWMIQARFRMWKRKRFVRPILSRSGRQGWDTRRAGR